MTPCSAEPGLLSEGPRWDARGANCFGSMSWPGGCTAPVSAQTASSRYGRRSRSIATVGAAAPAVGGGYVLAAGPGFLYRR